MTLSRSRRGFGPSLLAASLIVMMVWMGVYSQSFLPSIGKTTAHVLDQTRINVPFRVGLEKNSKLVLEAHNGR